MDESEVELGLLEDDDVEMEEDEPMEELPEEKVEEEEEIDIDAENEEDELESSNLQELLETGVNELEDPIREFREKAVQASSYDITPTVAIPMATSINACAFTSGLRWLFTGGEDGYIRKYDFAASVNGQLPLTVAQKHPFVDTIVNAGVLLNYFTNGYEVDKPSPVYSLAVHTQGLWALSGVNNGDIIMYSTRHQEGYPITSLKKHTAPVSILTLHSEERSVLSGSWDRDVHLWDLETGNVKATFSADSGQVSHIQYRPVPGTITGTESDDMESLFGSPVSRSPCESLFGEEEAKQKDEEKEPLSKDDKNQVTVSNDENTPEKQEEGNVFYSLYIDGILALWDQRQPNVISKYPVPKGVPPWAMSASWAVDGNSIFVGRRNGIVEEFNVHGPKEPVRVLRMPANSGPVSAVCPTPNGRYLVTGSYDNVRLYDLQKTSGINFLIISGHHGGLVSTIFTEPSCRFMISASGNRGWEGTTTEALLGYVINSNP
ncbi:SAGA complex subunit Spt8 [Schizosaccharomyces japonicus yFS275]|uniref:SAGA complex subunit Spt8 n=1 Tax=Schizosaccharomyces japonicus (strain yFS275 / FY16936) TaxID=402676 RepID=B6JZM3_SCHJY|nr:SAGA complex subunit Spt8 [Schizosaccharomyces japonicus yFS275]EEB06991.1 SAGA complex subunit Spt8 [Schizosaccharomyces japonicus yFS275]